MTDLKTLAIAFHAGAEQIRSMKDPDILGPDGQPLPVNPMGEISRAISADVLQTIGNIYLGLAANEEETSNTSRASH